LPDNDNKAFVAIVAMRHGQRLKRFLQKRLRNRADAPDLVQEVYLRLLRAHRRDEIRSPEAYLLTVASHLMREHTVRQAALPAMVNIEDLLSELRAEVQDDPALQAETDERLRVVERALERLSPKAHAVLMLHRRDGYSLEEIATQIGVSRSMAKKYLSQALAHCRQRLERMERE
jgi:RNA polymerase sigma factor (sigma-70 family)